MRELISLIMLFMFVLTTGCASGDGYRRYLEAKQYQVAAERKPLLALELDENGRVASIEMFPAPPRIDIQQEKDHPGYALAGGVVRIFGIVGSIWAAGDAITNIVDASSGDSSYINSANNNSENAGTISSDYNDIITTTTDNSTAEKQ